MQPRIGDWIQTFSGKRFYPFDPRPEEIDIEDIAHALSMQCRFSGHTREFYSVAQHSFEVSLHCGEHALWGLLHDASEAYLADVATPVKRHPEFVIYRTAEKMLMQSVCERFGLPYDQPKSVTNADVILLVSEARDFMAPLVCGWHHVPENGFPELPYKLEGLSPSHSKTLFLERFRELTQRLDNR